METMVTVWTMVEHVRVASGAAELAIFAVILYWLITSSRVADMLEVVGERVGGWCGRDSSLRHAVRARRRHHHADVYAKLDNDLANRTTSLYRVKEGPVVPAPQPQTRPPVGLACARCGPISRDSWLDPKAADSTAIINVLDIGRQKYANAGVVPRYLHDIVHCCSLKNYTYRDLVPSVEKNENVQRAIDDKIEEELRKLEEKKQDGGGDRESPDSETIRKRVEASASKVIRDISSAMSNRVLKFVGWACYKAIRRIALGGLGSRADCVQRLRRANAAGLPLVFVPLHRSHFDYILLTFMMYLTGVRPPLVAAGDNMRIPFFGWFLRGCGAFFVRRRVEGSDYHAESIYKASLRAYILNSLADHNNLEFFIEGGRTRTGKPQTPKAGILSVIMEAYLDGTIDDALLVPVSLNYDKLVDGSFVREQLGMPKQMETFWSTLRGIWRTLNTNHGAIRVHYNQPISLKELVTSFQKYNQYKEPVESPEGKGSLATSLDRQILYNHSHSSLYGADVSTDYKIMVEAIGRHLVYDAAQASAVMSTNVVAYVLLTELRNGGTMAQLQAAVEARASALVRTGRDLGYSGSTKACVNHALDMLGRGLVRREGSNRVRPQLGVAAALELGYYANTLVAHYAAPAIVATALESILVESNEEQREIRHSDLIEAALQLSEVLSLEFILCAPCQRIEERLVDAVDELIAVDVLSPVQAAEGLAEEQWSRRFASRLEEDEEERPDPSSRVKYCVSHKPEAVAERRRLIRTLRPLLEAYSATCQLLTTEKTTVKSFVKETLSHLTEEYTQNRMVYGEAVSTDAIRNCLKMLRQWGVVELYNEGRERMMRPSQEDHHELTISNVLKFNMDTPLLREQ